jgi:FKBP-type peptidyl-prolyl cis-trans isomerase
MKIFNTILITLLVLFLLSFAAFEFFDISVNFSKKSDNIKKIETTNQDATMQEENKQTETTSLNLPQEINELMAQKLKEGTGEAVKAGDKITVHYTGYLTNGTKFDSSVNRGTPFQITIGVGQVIPGWDQGILGMLVGEQRRLLIPAELAYGEAGVPGAIPPNSPLIFDVELISIDEKAPVGDGDLVEPITEETPTEENLETPSEE